MTWDERAVIRGSVLWLIFWLGSFVGENQMIVDGVIYISFGGMDGEQNQMLTRLNMLVYMVGVVFVCVALTVNWAYQLLWGKSLWSDHGLNRDG